MHEIIKFEEEHSKTPVTKIIEPFIADSGVQLFVKREDLIHPQISGNKWRKLKYNLIEARKRGISTLLTFGGAFSNHIHATAAAGDFFGFKTIGIIRGEKPQILSPTLKFAIDKGMKLYFVSRAAYRDKKALASTISQDLNPVYVLPEGGTNNLALKGCSEIVKNYIDNSNVDIWCSPCGTGGTLAGLVTALSNNQKAVGFSVLKGDFLKTEVEQLLSNFGHLNSQNWSINTAFHFGGYAKFDNNLIQFINKFKADHQIQLDPIYTGKMFYGIYDLIQKGFFPKGSTIMAVHTGGQQGITGFNQRFGNILQ